MNESEKILKVYHRESGKKAVKAVRNNDLIPGIFYLKTGESHPFSVNVLDVRDIVYTAHTRIVNMQFDGDTEIRECVLKHVDFDPVTDKIIHMDFYGIVAGQKLTLEVPVILSGTAIGVREGGQLQHTLRTVQIECLPKDLPDVIEVDITNLKLGGTIYIKNLVYDSVHFLIPENTTIASVIQPRVLAKEAETKAPETKAAAKK